ncbi:hypothetical protein Tco_0232728 [Tanacetum coccineum]
MKKCLKDLPRGNSSKEAGHKGKPRQHTKQQRSEISKMRWDTPSSIVPDLCIIDPRYLKYSLDCRILSLIGTSTSLLWAISTLTKSRLRYSVLSTMGCESLSMARQGSGKIDRDDFTQSPLFRHLHACEDLVEEAISSSNARVNNFFESLRFPRVEKR